MNKIKKIINFIIYLIAILVFIAPIILEYLSKTKMGVYRYVIAKSIKLEKLIYPDSILFIKIIFIIAIISSITIIIFKYEKKVKINLILISILSIIGYFISVNKVNFKGYYFFLIAIFVDIIILCLLIISNKFISKI